MGFTLTWSVSPKPFTCTTLLSTLELGAMVAWCYGVPNKECKITWHCTHPAPSHHLKCRNFRKLLFLLPIGQSKGKNQTINNFLSRRCRNEKGTTISTCYRVLIIK